MKQLGDPVPSHIRIVFRHVGEKQYHTEPGCPVFGPSGGVMEGLLVVEGERVCRVCWWKNNYRDVL